MKMKYDLYCNISITGVYTANFFMLLNELGNSFCVALDDVLNSMFVICFN